MSGLHTPSASPLSFERISAAFPFEDVLNGDVFMAFSDGVSWDAIAEIDCCNQTLFLDELLNVSSFPKSI
jgi:hypothetical protein